MNRDLNNLLFCLNMSTSLGLNGEDYAISNPIKKRKLMKIFVSHMWADHDITDAVCHYGSHGLVIDKPIPFKKFRIKRPPGELI